MATKLTDCQTLDNLIDELDHLAKSQHPAQQSADRWACQRRYPRHPFRVAAKIRFLMPGSSTIMELAGRTRNLSRSGVGLLVRRMFSVDEPVEIEILPLGRPHTFVAGVVRFCRYAGRGFHEIGVELKAAGPHPVFSHQPDIAARTLDWLRQPATRGM